MQINTQEMVQNIVQCLEYKHNKRKARQNSNNLPPIENNVEKLHHHMMKLNMTYNSLTEVPTDTPSQTSAATVSESELSTSIPYTESSQNNPDDDYPEDSLLQSSQPTFTTDDAQNLENTMPDSDEDPVSTDSTDQSHSTPSYKQTNPPPTSPLDEIYETNEPCNSTESPMTLNPHNSILKSTDQSSTTDFEPPTPTYQPDTSENNEVEAYKPIPTETPLTKGTITSNFSLNPILDYKLPATSYHPNSIKNEEVKPIPTETLVTKRTITGNFSLNSTYQSSIPDYESLTLAFQPNSSKNEEIIHYKPIPTEILLTKRTIPGNFSLNPTYQSSTPDYMTPTQTSQSNFSENEADTHPHIHTIDVQCAKDMMTVNLEFNKVYNGIIYSKGFFSNPNCRYVQENSNQIKYTFTLSLMSCGTEFINGFDTQGQSYLENVLVLQNEVGFQEVWDSIKSVRCLWEGNINKQLSVALSVGMLNQETVTFSGDTAMASLDIQVGKGPFAQPANGLVKIGETMTLVISVTGDPAFDIQVKDCVARDADSDNIVRLTDDDGCILKPKIFGAFQKTKETGNTGVSILAYAFFSAFKFPDAMDLIMECNVELCKTNCDMCSEPNQKSEPGKRRRRDTFTGYDTLVDPVRVGKGLKVVVPGDISSSEPLGICLSYTGFLWSAGFTLFALFISCVTAGFMWLKLQKHSQCKNYM